MVSELYEISELLKRDEYIVQEYVEKPLLVNKKKFDLRIYVVLFGAEPMHSYLYEEGMARFCTVDYQQPSASNKKNEYMHLSNYSINKNSEDYVKNDNLAETQATKRKLSDIYRAIEHEKENGAEVVEKIKENISDV